ncbi:MULTISPECIES: 50S ribosomal protein L24 [unclassified Agrococcus]|uniref:50S ribosomal protein L24 n=1 Tax=unclassified Agrococcus TaxID=2615065 RepID=UPI00361A1E85
MATIKKGDTVQVIAGARESRGGDRGKTGRVLEVLKEQDRVIVEGVNLVTKHVKVGQTQRGTKTGGIETHEAPIHVSNVALVDPETKKPTRVRSSITKVEKDGVQVTTKVRVSTRSGKEIKSND